MEKILGQLGATDTMVLRDQFLQCAETGPRKTLQNTMGVERLKNITLDNLLMEMEKTAVEKQSDLLNNVPLMETK